MVVENQNCFNHRCKCY